MDSRLLRDNETNLVTPRTRGGESFGPLGPRPTFTEGTPFPASVREVTAKVTTSDGKRTSQRVTKLRVRGVQNYDLATTEFLWNGRVLRPIELGVRTARGSHRRWTVILCEDVTGKSRPVQPTATTP